MKFILLATVLVSIIFAAIVISIKPSPGKRWSEGAERDGWSFVGLTPEGHAIMKKYFREHGVWIFAAFGRGGESISAVPLEILQRTEVKDSTK